MKETVNEITPAAEQTPAPVEPKVMKACQTSGCTWRFEEGKGFVPALPLLYQKVRGGDVDHRYPLTKSEVMSQEVCPMRCASQLRRNGIQAHPTVATLRLMERWAGENAAYLERQRLHQEWEERNAHRSVVHMPDNRGFVRETFRAMAKPQEEKPGRQKRHHVHISKPERNPNAPKNFGNEGRRITPVEEASNKKKRKKGKGDEDGGKGKNKRK